MDDELMQAINDQADRAAEARPKTMDRKALALALHADFDQKSVEEIEEKLTDVWRSRGLFFAEIHR